MEVAAEFERYMRDCIRRCKEFGYNAGYWKRMVVDHGAVEASHRLLTGTRASDGFTRLWEEGRLDLSVEFSVLLPKYRDLFNDDERAEARRRLGQYEFDVDGHLASWSESGAISQEPAADIPESVAEPVAAVDGLQEVPTVSSSFNQEPSKARLLRSSRFGQPEITVDEDRHVRPLSEKIVPSPVRWGRWRGTVPARSASEALRGGPW